MENQEPYGQSNSHHTSGSNPYSQGANFNPGAGRVYNNPPHQQAPTYIINPPVAKSNGVGIAGFVLSVISLVTGFIPFVGWLVWFLGLLLSFIAVFKKPRGFAIAGLIISLLGLILLVVVFGALVALSSVGHTRY